MGVDRFLGESRLFGGLRTLFSVIGYEWFCFEARGGGSEMRGYWVVAVQDGW